MRKVLKFRIAGRDKDNRYLILDRDDRTRVWVNKELTKAVCEELINRKWVVKCEFALNYCKKSGNIMEMIIW
jgi:hypothetical protein